MVLVLRSPRLQFWPHGCKSHSFRAYHGSSFMAPVVTVLAQRFVFAILALRSGFTFLACGSGFAVPNLQFWLCGRLCGLALRSAFRFEFAAVAVRFRIRVL